MAFDEKMEVIQHVEHYVEQFIHEKMKEPEECWQPTDFLPDFSDPDFQDKIQILQKSIANVPDTVLVSLVGNMITEEALPSYQTFFNLLRGINEERNVSSSGAWARWSRLWTAEENRHGDLLNKYLYLSGRVDMKVVEKSIQQLIYNGVDLQTDGDPYHGLIYTSFQERATKITHVNTGKLAYKSGDSALAKICNTIAGEEALHEKAYKFFMGKIFEADPNGGLAAFVAMMKKKIIMPANLMDFGTEKRQYLNYVNITQKIGVYTSFDYAGIIDHLVKTWRIDELKGLNDEGKRAQDFLSTLSERYFKLAERMQEPTELELVWLNK
ncbi:MAG: acyl-ACP desaturase [Cryomorphaceae bacterium]|nr:acyl-ACP desaturase [Cryomorphaceae bacterium]